MSKSKEMEEKINDLYRFIVEMSVEKGYPPTVREICAEFNIKSTSSASYYLRKLEQKKLIKINKGKSRAIELIGDGSPPSVLGLKSIPLIGTITAGNPILAVEDYEDTFSLPTSLFPISGDSFMLRVEGTSMIEAGINHGDIIIVKQQNTAENGQIIAALLDNECATVKRFYKDEKGIRLHPENRHMSDIYPDELLILGIVVGLIRTDIK